MLKELYKKRFLCDQFLEALSISSLFVRFSKAKILELDATRLKYQQQAEEIGLDEKRVSRVLDNYILALKKERIPTKTLENLVIKFKTNIDEQIAVVPISIKKSEIALIALIEIYHPYSDFPQLYDAIVLLRTQLEDGVDSIVKEIVKLWKTEAKRHQKDSMSATDIFWGSHRDNFELDAVSRYRFREQFTIGEFQDAFEDVEYSLGTALVHSSSGFEGVFLGMNFDLSIPFNLWLIGRSGRLSARIGDFVKLGLMRIASEQLPQGCWPYKGGYSDGNPQIEGVYLTALCSLALIKLSVSDKFREQAIVGIRWLLDRQNSDGSWSESEKIDIRVHAPDLFITVLAIEAVARSGIPDTKRSIDLALEWLLSQQNKLGMWEETRSQLPPLFMTILILEVLETSSLWPPSINLSPQLAITKGFLKRGSQFADEGNSNSHRLAIISAFQAIEAFLYAVLDHVDISIWVSGNHDHTIGMRSALMKFQEYLHREKLLKNDEVISYRNSLLSLANVRDQVVHKGFDVSDTTCKPLVQEAINFVNRYGPQVFGHDILS